LHYLCDGHGRSESRGTKYRGDFEKRMKVGIHELKKQPGAILIN